MRKDRELAAIVKATFKVTQNVINKLPAETISKDIED